MNDKKIVNKENELIELNEVNNDFSSFKPIKKSINYEINSESKLEFKPVKIVNQNEQNSFVYNCKKKFKGNFIYFKSFYLSFSKFISFLFILNYTKTVL